MLLEASQPTLDEAVPLAEIDFCVVDLETTGGSPHDAGITEIGAVRYRGGERLGTFETLVNPMRPISRFVANLTGIDDRMVRDALAALPGRPAALGEAVAPVAPGLAGVLAAWLSWFSCASADVALSVARVRVNSRAV